MSLNKVLTLEVFFLLKFQGFFDLIAGSDATKAGKSAVNSKVQKTSSASDLYKITCQTVCTLLNVFVLWPNKMKPEFNLQLQIQSVEHMKNVNTYLKRAVMLLKASRCSVWLARLFLKKEP